MSISSALQWWEEWQLRILVLASLFVYYILNFSFTVRWFPNLRRLRVVIWIAYIGSDALAIYALATLFNRQKQTMMTHGGSIGTATALEVVWAPILLAHLGGLPTISAYSLEDNELWKRHAVTFMSQVTVALYVFCKWWSGEKRLLQAAVLLFIVGIIKFAQKPWALRLASFNSMLDSVPMSLQQGSGEDLTLQEYVKQAWEKKATTSPDVTSDSYIGAYSNRMFVDMSAPYSVRLSELQSFVKLEDEDAHDTLQRCLAHTFQHLYSRMESHQTWLAVCLRIPIPSLSIASVVLLAKSNMDGYDKNDVRVTYILYYGNLIMEFLPTFLACLYMPFKQCRQFMFSRRWHNMVSQCSLLSFCVRKKNPTVLMKLATFRYFREYLNIHWYIKQESVAPKITRLVRRHLKNGWENHIHDAEGYKRFNNQLGLGVKDHDWKSSAPPVPFDHSVLLWHIATDLCFYDPIKFPQGDKDTPLSSSSREISNYMIYLLCTRPEMLMPGTRPSLFMDASKEIGLILNSSKAVLDKEESHAHEIINTVKSKPGADTYSLIRHACSLAEALMKLGDDKRWTEIQRMWVEMLCYSAVRCRGYLHAKSLGEGGECLTSIWLLWSFMGMETLADKLQRPESSAGKADASTPSSSQSQGTENQFPENFRPPV